MKSCSICLGKLASEEKYHAECIESLFGTPTFPGLDVDLTSLYRLAATNMAGKMSISGTQEKVSLTLSPDKSILEVTANGGRYILKPEISRYSPLPQNEQLTMRLARLVSVEVPPCGLVQLKDGATAYVIKRFDRLDDGTKIPTEDFCQLAEKRLRDKYDGSAELCVRTLRKYATEPMIEIQKLFRLILFSWWIENGDMHLKNFSLITKPDGICCLSPAYDLLCTKLVIPDDHLAMPVGGRNKGITRKMWLEFAEYCRIPSKAANRLISEQIEALGPACALVLASFLPDVMKEQYEGFLRANTAALKD